MTKKKTQVVSISGDNVQVMDSETYAVFELPIPDELKGRLAAGAEVEVIEAMDRKAVSRILSG
jgi:translation initiation factor 5A